MQLRRRSHVLRRDLRAIWVDGLAWSSMVGLGELYIVAFALALGYASELAGLAATVPMVLGAVLQLVTPAMVRRLGSEKRWVVLCAGIQAASFVPLAIAALVGSLHPVWLYLTAAVYWGAGFGTSPAWNTWVATLVPARVRTRYFARRNRYVHAFQLMGLFAGGWILHAGERASRPLVAFAFLFLFASLARVLSRACLQDTSEHAGAARTTRDVSMREYVRRFKTGSDGRLLVYMLAVHFSVHVSAPFYGPYLLSELEFTYLQYMAILTTAVAAKFAALPFWGRVAERHGVRALLWFGGIGIAPSVGLWLVSDDFVWLLCAQLFAGLVWGAWELATFLLFFDAIDPDERTSVLTTHNTAHATAVFAGSLAGASLLRACGAGEGAFLVLMATSTALRLSTLFLLKRCVPRGPLTQRAVSAGFDAFLKPALRPFRKP